MENSASLPIDYELDAEWLGAVRLGEPLVAWRQVRNGVQKQGLFISTPVTELLVSTVNSLYRVTVASGSSVTSREVEPAMIIEAVSVALGVHTTDVARWIYRFGANGTDGDILGIALQRLTAIIVLIPCFGSRRQFQSWMRMSNELLAGNSPLDLLADERLEEVADYLSDAASGQPT